MSEIPEDFIKFETERLRSLVEKLVEFEAKNHDEREAAALAEHVHDDLLVDFESIRANAKSQLDAGGLSHSTGQAYHSKVQDIENALLEGFLRLTPHGSIDLEAGSAAESWYWAIQLSFGIHYISHVKSGSMGATGPVILGHGGSKTCIPPHSC